GAEAAVVAGRVAREKDGADEDDDEDDDDDEGYWYSCWPSGTTGSPPFLGTRFTPDSLSDLPALRSIRSDDDYGYGGGDDYGDIIVTGSRIARLEPLGDLKLYRIPFPVTVASRSQKQAAFLSSRPVKGELVAVSREPDSLDDPEWLFRFTNDRRSGLGQPLPRGDVVLFQPSNGRPMLIGESKIDDKAEGEEVEILFGESSNVAVETDWLRDGEGWEERRLTVSNANPYPIVYEAEFQDEDHERFERFSARMIRRKGKQVWRVTVGAEATARLDYRKVDVEESDEAQDVD
ncbi:MAG TPA: hypothetical protein VEA60_12305, partial [Allosphingosinicella sp.]|nr:hypothetical protein [Allosphingosinicella sp.]